jgi:hypothetical protein
MVQSLISCSSFDHSCGHDRQCEDGLNAARMLKSYVGKQPKIHSTEIKQHQGYLGTYPDVLSIHDNQDMVFSLADSSALGERLSPRWK